MASSEKKKVLKNIARDALKLFAITVITGIILGFVHEVTLPAITRNNALARQKAFTKAYPEAEQFLETEELESFALTEGDSLLTEIGYKNIVVQEIRIAADEAGNQLGYVAVVSTSEGYGGNITLLIGYSNEGVVKGMDIMEINETPGLGTKAGEDPFISQFAYKNVIEFVYTKMGAVADNEIDAISGATITTKAVVDAANAGIKFILSVDE